MDSNLEVDPDGVRDAGLVAYQTAKYLIDALRSAGIDVQNMLDSGWTGHSARAYSEGWQELFAGGMEVLQALKEISQLLGFSAESYSIEDENTESTLSSLNI